jgi:exodeoxyribonuclease VII large subunit
MRIVEVSWLTRYLKDLLAEDYTLQDIWVQGEISGYKLATSGHRYFTLKDANAAMRCVLFASYPAPPLRDGMAAIVHGRMSIWEQRGDIQFYADDVRDAGAGLLNLRFEALKARLEAEGLFAPERKRPLLERVHTVGIVTSPQAAALRDILRALRLRCPLVHAILAPTLVQGEGAAAQIAAAIDLINTHGQADVVIVARGGGSIEELWSFNEEIVARAIVRSPIPVITGIGHETDFTIADFVADYRASTPTAAAIAAVPDAAQWRLALEETSLQLDDAVLTRLTVEAEQLAGTRSRLDRASPARAIETARQRVDETTDALALRIQHTLKLRTAAVAASALRLHALSPLLTLARGYAVVRREADGSPVTSTAQVAPGDGLSLQLSDGRVSATAGVRLPNAPDSAAERNGGVAVTSRGRLAEGKRDVS